MFTGLRFRYDLRLRIANTAAVVVALAGLFAAAVLSIGHLLDLPVPCGGSRGCATVAAHPSSRLFGLPIAYIGVGAYLTYLVLIGRTVIGRWARWAAFGLSGFGTMASAGLLIYSHTVIRATCPWCVVSGVVMAVLFVLSSVALRYRRAGHGPRPVTTWTLAILTAAAIGLQAGRMQRAAVAPPIGADRLATVRAGEWLDSAKSLGPADAAVTVTIFGDFLCPACRGALGALLRYQNEHAKDVRVVYRHLPLGEIRGHESSKAAAALSEMAGEHGEFWTFAHAVHSQRGQMSRTEYLELMRKLGFEPAAVEARLDDSTDRAIQNVQRDIALAGRLGIRATPTFIVQIGTHAPVSATERGLARILNSTTVVSLLAERHQLRVAQR